MHLVRPCRYELHLRPRGSTAAHGAVFFWRGGEGGGGGGGRAGRHGVAVAAAGLSSQLTGPGNCVFPWLLMKSVFVFAGVSPRVIPRFCTGPAAMALCAAPPPCRRKSWMGLSAGAPSHATQQSSAVGAALCVFASAWLARHKNLFMQGVSPRVSEGRSSGASRRAGLPPAARMILECFSAANPAAASLVIFPSWLHLGRNQFSTGRTLAGPGDHVFPWLSMEYTHTDRRN
jgi:hypothetical protein